MASSTSGSPVSRRAALAGLGAGGLGVAAAVAAPSASAQDAMDPATHLLAGVWQWNAYPEQPELSTFAIFHPSGTYTEWQPVAGEAVGLWRPTGAHRGSPVHLHRCESGNRCLRAGHRDLHDHDRDRCDRRRPGCRGHDRCARSGRSSPRHRPVPETGYAVDVRVQPDHGQRPGDPRSRHSSVLRARPRRFPKHGFS